MAKLNRAINQITPRRKVQGTPLGAAGFDNPRENIDPQIKTKSIQGQEAIIDKRWDTDDNSRSYYGLKCFVENTQALASPAYTYSLNFTNDYSGTGSNYRNIGILGFVRNMTTGTIEGARALHGAVRNVSSGEITNAIGCQGYIFNEGLGKMTDAFSFRNLCGVSNGSVTRYYSYFAGAPSITGSGSIGTVYQFYCKEPTGAGTMYGFRQDGSSTINWFEGDLYMRGDAETRYYDSGNSNYVALKAPALTSNTTYSLPVDDGSEGNVLYTDGSGQLGWTDNASKKVFAFSSPQGTTGTFYYGGFYMFSLLASNFAVPATMGTALASYAAKILLVLGQAAVDDITIRLTGTSIDCDGNRQALDTEDIVIPNGSAVNDYFQSTKEWIGTVIISHIAGTAKNCNYGFVKAWNNCCTDFKVEGCEATWLGGANDANPNIAIRHHKTTGWTYNALSAPTPPSTIADMNSDHVTEIQVRNNEMGSWKRRLSSAVSVEGSGDEGIIIEVVTSANRAFEQGNIIIRTVPD